MDDRELTVTYTPPRRPLTRGHRMMRMIAVILLILLTLLILVFLPEIPLYYMWC